MIVSSSACQRPRLFALVLGGGAARGAAHIGALQALVEEGLQPDLVVGVSIGAIVGAGFGSGQDPMRGLDRLREAAAALQSQFLNLPPLAKACAILRLFGRRQRRRWLEDRLDLKGLSFGSLRPSLLIAATRLLPFGRAVFGLNPGESVIEPLMATSALPSRLPIRYGGRLFVDGALSGNLPTRTAMEQGARVIVAINLGFLFKRRQDFRRLMPWRVIDWIGKAQMRREADRCRRSGASVIEITSSGIEAESILAFERLDKLIEEGYKATRLSLPAIKGALRRERLLTAS
jgi:NTE family protein